MQASPSEGFCPSMPQDCTANSSMTSQLLHLSLPTITDYSHRLLCSTVCCLTSSTADVAAAVPFKGWNSANLLPSYTPPLVLAHYSRQSDVPSQQWFPPKMSTVSEKIQLCESLIGYTFIDRNHCAEALYSYSSTSSEFNCAGKSNERLAILGNMLLQQHLCLQWYISTSVFSGTFEACPAVCFGPSVNAVRC